MILEYEKKNINQKLELAFWIIVLRRSFSELQKPIVLSEA